MWARHYRDKSREYCKTDGLNVLLENFLIQRPISFSIFLLAALLNNIDSRKECDQCEQYLCLNEAVLGRNRNLNKRRALSVNMKLNTFHCPSYRWLKSTLCPQTCQIKAENLIILKNMPVTSTNNNLLGFASYESVYRYFRSSIKDVKEDKKKNNRWRRWEQEKCKLDEAWSTGLSWDEKYSRLTSWNVYRERTRNKSSAGWFIFIFALSWSEERSEPYARTNCQISYFPRLHSMPEGLSLSFEKESCYKTKTS